MFGDDTWVSLFPPERWFADAAPFPSLNVKDIDGCDDHVARHLAALLRRLRPGAAGAPAGGSAGPGGGGRHRGERKSHGGGGGGGGNGGGGGGGGGTTVAIGHFLGVDHVGHR